MRKYSRLITDMVVSLHHGTCEHENIETLAYNMFCILNRLDIISKSTYDDIYEYIKDELNSCEQVYYDTFVAMPKGGTAR